MNKHRSVGSLSHRKDVLSDYEHHRRRMNDIQRFPRHWFEESTDLSKLRTWHKWKETAKAHELRQHDDEIKKQNKHLLQRLWKISEGELIHKRQMTLDPHQITIKHRALSQKRFNEKVIEENKILAKNLVQQSRNMKSKQRLKEEMSEYLTRRLQIRKVLMPQEVRKMRKMLKASQPDIRKLSPRSVRPTK